MAESLQKKMENRLALLPSGSVISMADFTDIATAKTISKYLSRVADKYNLKKVIRGIFWKNSDQNKQPDPDLLAKAIARSNTWRVVPSGETALYSLGMIDKKPEIWTYATDGTYRDYEIDNISIRFHHTTGRLVHNMSQKTALLVQVLKAYGETHLNHERLNKIKSFFSQEERKKAIHETRGITDWISNVINNMFETKTEKEIS